MTNGRHHPEPKEAKPTMGTTPVKHTLELAGRAGPQEPRVDAPAKRLPQPSSSKTK